jgi:hypothetical protein
MNTFEAELTIYGEPNAKCCSTMTADISVIVQGQVCKMPTSDHHHRESCQAVNTVLDCESSGREYSIPIVRVFMAI